jgi:outer membrane protein OmpA-like peptidoglycan-associated protein/tetratricopeptide (TPR) repeat protein
MKVNYKIRMMFSAIAIVISLCFALNEATAQGLNKLSQKRADDLYKNMAYREAADLYNHIVNKDATNAPALKKAALCYLKINNYEMAEKHYAKVVELPAVEAEEYLNYAMVLQTLGKDAEAKAQFENFRKNANMDKRGERALKAYDARQEFYRDSAYYQLMPFQYNTANDDFSPSFYRDGLVFVSNGQQKTPAKSVSSWTGQPFYDLYYARFSGSADSIFFEPSLFSKQVNTKFNEGPVSFNYDMNVLVFSRNYYFKNKDFRGKDKSNHQQLFLATDKVHDWKNIKTMNINNADYSVCHPALNRDGTVMYFASNMEGGFGGMDIYMSKNEGGKWSEPVNLGVSVNTEGNEMFPYVVNDSLLYFASNGHSGLGGLDIYAGQIEGNKVKNVVNVGYPINTSYDDFGLIYDHKKKVGFFSSNRPGGKGGDDIYRFRNVKPSHKIRLRIFDEASKEPLKNVKLTVYDKDKKVYREVMTDTEGSASVVIDKNMEYSYTASIDKYFDQAGIVDPAEMKGFEMNIEVPLHKDLGFKLVGVVTDDSKNPLTDAHVIITEKATGRVVFDGNTNSKGEFFKSVSNYSINQTMDLEIKLDKKGYLGRTIPFIKKLTRSGDININEVVPLSVDAIKVGVDIGKLVDLKPIYFDSGKWNIRPDAAVELDKIVKAMLENPALIIEVGSHTDSRGAANANLTLSDKRAKSSVDYIVSQGIEAKRISGKGYGESQIINRCKDNVKCSDDEHQQNRRTEFKVVRIEN